MYVKKKLKRMKTKQQRKHEEIHTKDGNGNVNWSGFITQLRTNQPTHTHTQSYEFAYDDVRLCFNHKAKRIC